MVRRLKGKSFDDTEYAVLILEQAHLGSTKRLALASVSLSEAREAEGLSSENTQSLERELERLKGQCLLCFEPTKDGKVMMTDGLSVAEERHEDCITARLSTAGTCPWCHREILRKEHN